MRRSPLIAFVVWALSAASAHSQDLNGSFTSGTSGETFQVQGNGDGTADIYGSDGRHVGTADDNGDGTWDIHTSGGRRIGEIQDNGDGSFEVNGAEGGHWGSGESE